ncbi:MAG: HemK family protein methyltransferase [Candidatus Pacebacteria bacterium]|nr:HemK family protein methyltransferase [Candidatus Paceibacterota bacterium]MDD4074103.1 HemK family protein methyltransferase [Candidatus Paceibacterota bacterium]
MELPEDYKKGYKYFLNTKIDLSKRPLIPREETEYWVDCFLKENNNKIKYLDLFSGSGCVGISILKNIKGSLCDFGEIKDEFIEQIKINIEINEIDKDRCKVLKTDIFSGINDGYDVILANPPYVAENRISEVGEDVKEFEPAIALYGGFDGMDIIEKFLEQAKNYLNDKGLIIMEFDPEQKEKIEKIVKEKYSKYNFEKDQFGLYRFIKIKK